MAMRMLEAGGVGVLTDDQRSADEDNPRGYFELERVKHLQDPADRAWLRAARGSAIKVVSSLLHTLPQRHRYQVIFMLRDLDEVLQSQDKMLAHRGEKAASAADRAALRQRYETHLWQVQRWMRARRNYSCLPLEYRRVIENPRTTASEIERFLGRALDTAGMAAAVDASLYRNRSAC
jgi:hypothetical protein